ncbi:hypothetical protein K438DRAFT_2002469 [Mycena galopus ATCC 62051]|nr:hypothetical protein K438DRAFT_2002469 [Mycena galopus ATCC 62051]
MPDTPGDKNAAPSLVLSTPKASHIYRPAPTGCRHDKSHRILIYHKACSTQRSSALNFCPDPIKLLNSLRPRKIPQANASLRKSVRGGISAQRAWHRLHALILRSPPILRPYSSQAPSRRPESPECITSPRSTTKASQKLSRPKNQVIDQDSKDLALAIHERGIQREHWAMTGVEVGLPPYSLPCRPLADERRTASRKFIEHLPVEPIGGQERARAEGGREDIQSRDSPLSSATRRDESALALLVDHAAAVRAVTYAETTRTTLLDAEKR